LRPTSGGELLWVIGSVSYTEHFETLGWLYAYIYKLLEKLILES